MHGKGGGLDKFIESMKYHPGKKIVQTVLIVQVKVTLDDKDDVDDDLWVLWHETSHRRDCQ